MTDARVTAERGLYLGCGFILVAGAVAWAVSGIGSDDLRARLGAGVARSDAALAAVPAEAIRGCIREMDDALRRGDRGAFLSYYADAAAGETAWLAAGPVQAAVTEVLDLEPAGEGFREFGLLTVIPPPSAEPSRRRFELLRLWLRGTDGAWRVASTHILVLP